MYYVGLCPGEFTVPDQEGLAEFCEPSPDSNTETTLTLVAEIQGDVVGYLEARLMPPLESVRWQGQPDLAVTQLFINALGTAMANWCQGVATRLVGAAESWGRAHGATVAVTDTYLGSPVSVPFWERRMGYRRRAVILRKPLL